MTRKEIGIIEELYHYYRDCQFQAETEDEADFYGGIMEAIEELEDRLGINTSEYYLEEELQESSELVRVLGFHTSVPFVTDSADVECQNMTDAFDVAKKMRDVYKDVYIRKESEFIYQML